MSRDICHLGAGCVPAERADSANECAARAEETRGRGRGVGGRRRPGGRRRRSLTRSPSSSSFLNHLLLCCCVFDFSPLFWFMHVMSCLCLCPLAPLSKPLHMCVCSRVCACSHVFVIYALVEGLRGEERRVNLSRLSLRGLRGSKCDISLGRHRSCAERARRLA